MNVCPQPGTVHMMRGFGIASLRFTIRCTVSRCFLNASTSLVVNVHPEMEQTHCEFCWWVFSWIVKRACEKNAWKQPGKEHG